MTGFWRRSRKAVPKTFELSAEEIAGVEKDVEARSREWEAWAHAAEMACQAAREQRIAEVRDALVALGIDPAALRDLLAELPSRWAG